MSDRRYTVAANIILRDLNSWVVANVPDMFNARQKALAAMPALAGGLAKDVVDAIDAMKAST